jgi:hypothetical protein
MAESNLWLVAFSLAVIAILFSQEISDYIYANDENYLLKQYSSQRTPNVSAWKVVPMSARGGGYGVIATRQILPGQHTHQLRYLNWHISSVKLTPTLALV